MIKMKYSAEKNSIIIPNEMFSAEMSNAENAWRELNNLELDISYKEIFIDKLYEKFKKGVNIVELIIGYAESCTKNMDTKKINLLMRAIKYGLDYNGYTIISNDSYEIVTIFLSERLWYVVEQESDTYYTPPKHARSIQYVNTMDGRNVPYEEASEIEKIYAKMRVSYNEHAEEMYSKTPKLRYMLQSVYCRR